MNEFKVGDRVITRWGEGLSHLPNKACVPEGVHTICEVFHENKKYVRLDTSGGWLYPISLMTKVDDAPAVKDDDSIFRDECAMRAMQGDWAAQNEESGYYTNSTDMEFLVKRAELYYRMADAMLEARKK